ncbi:MAG: hypothetical protein V1672_02350 [Candidatus Diapherotrites archaeon]
MFDWSDVENADSYFAKVKMPSGNVIEFPVPSGKSQYVIPANVWASLPLGNYTWQVKSKRGTAESKYSGAWSFTKVG